MQITKDKFEAVKKTKIVTVSDEPGETIQIFRVEADNYQFATSLEFQSCYFIWGCELVDQARLAAGVFEQADHQLYSQVSKYRYPGEIIPTSIACAGRQVIASYMKLFYDEDQHVKRQGSVRKVIADRLSVNPNTVSQYWNRVRWDGCIECGGENIEKKILGVEGDDVKIADCYDCGAYHVLPEDIEKSTHTPLPEEDYPSNPCVDELVPTIATHDGDEYQLWGCDGCGFYSAGNRPIRTQFGAF